MDPGLHADLAAEAARRHRREVMDVSRVAALERERRDLTLGVEDEVEGRVQLPGDAEAGADPRVELLAEDFAPLVRTALDRDDADLGHEGGAELDRTDVEAALDLGADDDLVHVELGRGLDELADG